MPNEHVHPTFQAVLEAIGPKEETPRQKRPALIAHCECGSVLSSVTWTCVRGEHCPVQRRDASHG